MAGDSSATGEPAALDEHFDVGNLHLLRDRVARCAAAAGMTPARSADIVLVAHELAANAVRHGPGAGHLLVQAADGMFCCQVSDTGPAPEHFPVRHGHGLWIVREIADTFDISCTADGTTVTAVFASPGRLVTAQRAAGRPG